MLNQRLKLNQDFFIDENKKSPRDGFGEALSEIAEKDDLIVTLAADLSESVKLKKFFEKFLNYRK